MLVPTADVHSLIPSDIVKVRLVGTAVSAAPLPGDVPVTEGAAFAAVDPVTRSV